MKRLSLFKVFVILLTTLFFSNNAFSVACNCEGFADIVKPLIPAVVNISTTQKVSVKNFSNLPKFPKGFPFEDFNELFERFGLNPYLREDDNIEEKEEYRPISGGSGFIIDKTGYIVTNNHVVAEADQITVTMFDDKKFEAKLIGADSRSDIAVLKIKTDKDLPFVKFGNSDTSRVGDIIIAIGNPFGLGGTVTSGIISANSRDINTDSIVDNFLQTDAAINQGNSGGPMFNINGEVIGINTAIASLTGGNIGIGFAVPSSFAEPIVEQIKKFGSVSRGWLGVSVQPTSNIAEGLGIKKDYGALIGAVVPGGPADLAGIKIGDIILEFNGKEITDYRKLPRIVASTKVGSKVEVILMSKGKKRKVTVILSEISDKEKITSNKSKDNRSSVMGMELEVLSDVNRLKYSIPKEINGILVVSIDRKSIAARQGIRAGDIIEAVNQQTILSLKEFKNIIDYSKKNNHSSVMLQINRGNTIIFLSLPIK